MRKTGEVLKKWLSSPGVWAAVLSVGLAVATESQADDRPAKAPQASVVAQAAPTPCDQVTRPDVPAVASKARDALDALWLRTETGYFAAFVTPGVTRNPFDLKPPPPDSGPRSGIVQARMPACTITEAGAGRHIVRFVSPLYRFHERQAGWSPPLRDGLMMEVEVLSVGNELTTRDTSAEKAILMPEQKIRRPGTKELPRLSRWSEPVPGCARQERWNGDACVRRRR